MDGNGLSENELRQYYKCYGIEYKEKKVKRRKRYSDLEVFLIVSSLVLFTIPTIAVIIYRYLKR